MPWKRMGSNPNLFSSKVFTFYYRLDIVNTSSTETEGRKMELQYNEFWQTQARGTNDQEYQTYLDLADDGEGGDITTGRPLKTYDEWLNS